MLADRLDKAWRAWRGSTAVDPVMRFTEQGLVFGAGTVLARAGRSGREISIDPSEPRLHALLSAAHLSRPTAAALAHLRIAADRRSEGEDAFAAMHLALSRIDRLDRPEADAHRMFLADGLLKDGVGADAVIASVEAGEPAFNRLGKYDPDQPRVPAGSGSTSGEWTSSDGNAFAGFSSGAAATLAQPAGSPQPEVNPGTITEAGYYNACRVATIECINAAAEVDVRSDNDNRIDGDPNGFKADVTKCRDADFVCNILSVAIEDIPFLDYGGVIFPHQGVVLMKKGYQDKYIPPLPGGKRPAFRRNLA
jgi:hypothetical protein